MANETNKSTEILEFKVEQGGAITELEKLRKTMVGLKEEQAQLSKAYKKGDITVEEYAKEITRVDTLLKKVATSHNQQQKAMAGVQTETSKLIKSNQQLTQTLKDSSSQITIAGQNVGQLQTRIASLANPITASIALVGALGAAYARSTIGAKDLAFAQSQLSAAITIGTNDFARLISSSEDGAGSASGLLNFFLNLTPASIAKRAAGGKTIADVSREIALAQERLDDLIREELQVREQISSRLSDNQELLTKIADEQTPLNEKTQAYSEIIGNLRDNQTEIVDVLTRQRDEIQKQLDGDVENEKLQTAVLQKNREIEKAKADTDKRIQAIIRQEDNLLETNRRQLQVEREKTSELERQQRIAILERSQRGNISPIEALRKEADIQVEITTKANQAMGKAQEDLANQVEAANKKQAKSNKGVAESTDAQRDALRLFSSEAARLYQTISKENRFFAGAQLAVDAGLTLSAIEKNSAELGPRAGAFYRAAAYLSAGASLAQAAKLIGTSSPGIENLGPTFTGTSGEQYVIQNGEAVPLEEAQRKAALKQQRTQDTSGALGAIATGAAIGSAVPVIGTVAGAIAGGLVYGIGLLFKRRRKKSGYADGGWTGPGEMSDVAGVVHADEYVVPKKIKNSNAAQPHLKALENMRMRGYATGGYTGLSSSSDNLISVMSLLRGINIQVAVSDINRQHKRQATKQAIVTQ